MPDTTDSISRQLWAITAAATTTLATYTAVVTSLPVVDLFVEVLPPAGPYQPLAGSLAILVSALLAYREFRHEAPSTSWEKSDIRRSGLPYVFIGSLLTLAYITFAELRAFGRFSDLLLAVVYALIVVSLSYGFVLIAMRAWDCTSRRARLQENLAQMRRKTREYELEARRLRAKQSGRRYTEKPSSGAPESEEKPVPDVAFRRFCTQFFIALSLAVTALAALTEALSLLPPIVTYGVVASVLSTIISVAIIGSSYTSIYLEDNVYTQITRTLSNMQRIAQRKGPTIDVGIRWILLGGLLMAVFVYMDIQLGHAPSENVLLELVALSLQVSIFALVTYGLWRFAVDVYANRTKSDDAAR